MKVRGLAVMVLALSCVAKGQQGAVDVTVVADNPPSPPAALGLGKLEAALHERKMQVEVVGPTDSPRGRFVITARVSEADKRAAESFSIRTNNDDGGLGLVLSAPDPVGLMYAEMQLAEDVANATDPGFVLARPVEVNAS